MKFIFYSGGAKHEVAVIRALAKSLPIFGHSIEAVPRKRYTVPASEGAIFLGVKGDSRKMLDDHVRAGCTVLYLDKGYVRRQLPNGLMELYRVSVNAFQPHAYMHSIPVSCDRWDDLGIKFEKPKKYFGRGNVVYAGSSQKYCNFKQLGDCTAFAKKVIAEIKLHDSLHRKIVYRPKPSWDDAVPIPGTIFSHPLTGVRISFEHEAERADLFVTHGSNACLEAAIKGVPSIVLDDGITKSFSVGKVSDLSKVKSIDSRELLKLCHVVAYQQWSLRELGDGTAMQYLQGIFEHVRK